MSTPQLTPEDQLVSDLSDFWAAHPPAAIPVYSFRRQGERAVPCLIIGHDGCDRVKTMGMEGTGHVHLRLAVMSDMDVTTPATHAGNVAAIDLAAMALTASPGQLALTWLHGILRDSPTATIEDRREITVLAYTAIATRCSS